MCRPCASTAVWMVLPTTGTWCIWAPVPWVGGAALVFTEAAGVSAEGRITHHDLGLYKDEHIEFLKRITDFIKAQGAVPGIQLAHAGRKASHHRPWEGGAALNSQEHPWTTKAPSAIPYKEGEPLPEELTKEGAKKVVDDFKQAALRAKKAGFRVIELHGAHGYLLHEFLSPLSNRRSDEYGGAFENRIRLLLQITEAVREVWEGSAALVCTAVRHRLGRGRMDSGRIG